jgi:predicted DNA-binding protein with PD1-like motif
VATWHLSGVGVARSGLRGADDAPLCDRRPALCTGAYRPGAYRPGDPARAFLRPAIGDQMKEITLHREGDHRRTFAFVLEPDEEPVTLLAQRAQAYSLASCQVTAVGGFSRATLGYFDRERRAYRKILIEEQVEVLSLLGDIAHEDGKRVVHVHCVVGLSDGTTRGGHLLEAQVWPTLEVIVTEWPTFLQKRFDPEVGLALIEPRRPDH